MSDYSFVDCGMQINLSGTLVLTKKESVGDSIGTGNIKIKKQEEIGEVSLSYGNTKYHLNTVHQFLKDHNNEEMLCIDAYQHHHNYSKLQEKYETENKAIRVVDADVNVTITDSQVIVDMLESSIHNYTKQDMLDALKYGTEINNYKNMIIEVLENYSELSLEE